MRTTEIVAIITIVSAFSIVGYAWVVYDNQQVIKNTSVIQEQKPIEVVKPDILYEVNYVQGNITTTREQTAFGKVLAVMINGEDPILFLEGQKFIISSNKTLVTSDIIGKTIYIDTITENNNCYVNIIRFHNGTTITGTNATKIWHKAYDLNILGLVIRESDNPDYSYLPPEKYLTYENDTVCKPKSYYIIGGIKN